MNTVLRTEIIKHIYACFGVYQSSWINKATSRSLMDKNWLLSSKITFQGLENTGDVWGCQLSTSDQELKIVLADCSEPFDYDNADINDAALSPVEFAMLVQLKNAPCYGLYLAWNARGILEPMIAVSVKEGEWMECNTFLQSSFLSGMEQVRDTGLKWNKCTSHQEEFKKLLSFIEYHQAFYGVPHEGKED